MTVPPFRGHRQRRSPDDGLFAEGDNARESWAKQQPQTHSRVWVPPWASKARGGAAQALRCSICKAVLPTLHLLDIHISELHDSFFAAQASRRMEVFQCLVQGCKQKFQGAAERKQHLMDLHAFPPGFHFESMHLRQRRAQQGKLKVGTRKERRRMVQLQTAQLIIAKELATADALHTNLEAPAGSGKADVGVSQLAEQLSRLTTAADTSNDPGNISFGRGCDRGLLRTNRARDSRDLKHKETAEQESLA